MASTVRALAKSIGEDIYKRPFITVGFTAWITMLPLAITSTAGMDPPARRQALEPAASPRLSHRRSSGRCTTGGW